MADNTSDGTPDTPASAPTPPRRRTRGAAAKTGRPAATVAAAKPKTRAPAASRTTPKAKIAEAATTAKTTVKRKAAQAKPAVKRAAKAVEKTADAAGDPKVRNKVLIGIGAAALSIAAGFAAKVGRKKITKVATETIDTVMGKSEPAEPVTPKTYD